MRRAGRRRTLLALGVDHLVHRKKLLKDIMALHTIDFNNYEGKGEDKEGWRSKGTALVPVHHGGRSFGSGVCSFAEATVQSPSRGRPRRCVIGSTASAWASTGVTSWRTKWRAPSCWTWPTTIS